MQPTRGTWTLLTCMGVCIVLAGCAGQAGRKSQGDLADLRSRQQQQQSLLKETQDRLRQLARQARAIISEKEELVGQLATALNNDQLQAQAIEKLQTQLITVEARLDDAREQADALRRTQRELREFHDRSRDAVPVPTPRREGGMVARVVNPDNPVRPAPEVVSSSVEAPAAAPVEVPAAGTIVARAPAVKLPPSEPAAAVNGDGNADAGSAEAKANAGGEGRRASLGKLFALLVVLVLTGLAVAKLVLRISAGHASAEEESDGGEENLSVEDAEEPEEFEFDVENEDTAPLAEEIEQDEPEPEDVTAEGGDKPDPTMDLGDLSKPLEEIEAEVEARRRKKGVEDAASLDLGDLSKPLEEIEAELKGGRGTGTSDEAPETEQKSSGDSPRPEPQKKPERTRADVSRQATQALSGTLSVDEFGSTQVIPGVIQDESGRTQVLPVVELSTDEASSPAKAEDSSKSSANPGPPSDELAATRVLSSDPRKNDATPGQPQDELAATRVLSSDQFGVTKVMAALPEVGGPATQVIAGAGKLRKTPRKPSKDKGETSSPEKALLEELEELMGG